jgi:hypothetical protein
MAFVYKAERNIVLANTEGAKNLNLGPGSYAAQKPSNRHHGSRPPFLTQTGRSGKASQPKTRHSHDMGVHSSSGMSFFMKGNKKASAPMQMADGLRADFTPGKSFLLIFANLMLTLPRPRKLQHHQWLRKNSQRHGECEDVARLRLGPVRNQLCKAEYEFCVASKAFPGR